MHCNEKGKDGEMDKQAKWINDEWHFHYLLNLLISFLSPLTLLPLAVLFFFSSVRPSSG